MSLDVGYYYLGIFLSLFLFEVIYFQLLALFVLFDIRLQQSSLSSEQWEMGGLFRGQ